MTEFCGEAGGGVNDNALSGLSIERAGVFMISGQQDLALVLGGTRVRAFNF